jgi:hypothetical protein
VGRLGRIGRQCLIVVVTGRRRIQREVELILPPEFEACLTQGVVPSLRALVSLGHVGSVRGDLVGDDTVFDVVAVRQA